MSTYVVLCLEGCHGSGKTALTKSFRDLGFTVMDEGFLETPPTLLHPQSLLMETAWVCGWFQRLMAHIKTNQKSAAPPTSRIIIADRSPLSAVFYSRSDGDLLEPLIRQYVRELREAADVHIHTVHLRTDRALLWQRIQQRLLVEPERAALREDQVDWMDAVLSFYDRMSWDVTVSNNEVSMAQLVDDVFSALCSVNAALKASLEEHYTGIGVPMTPLAGMSAASAAAAAAAAAAASPLVPTKSSVAAAPRLDGMALDSSVDASSSASASSSGPASPSTAAAAMAAADFAATSLVTPVKRAAAVAGGLAGSGVAVSAMGAIDMTPASDPGDISMMGSPGALCS